jgi:uncharacterized protein
MKKNILMFFRPEKELLVIILTFFTCVLINFISDLFRGTLLFHLFYQGIFVLGICIFFPLWFIVIRQKQPLLTIGITTNKWIKAVLIGILIATITSVGRIMGMHIILPNTVALLYLVCCLIMSTLFEEVFFRGFLQTRFEKSFGMIPAIILSGLCFSLYHVGYNSIRANLTELIPLFFTGIFFSISFRITNNIITSFIVNLPHAIITFIGEQSFISYSTHFDKIAAILSLITTLIGLFLIIFVNTKVKSIKSTADFLSNG